MFNFDVIKNENNVEHNPKWPYIPDHPYRSIHNWRLWIRKD